MIDNYVVAISMVGAAGWVMALMGMYTIRGRRR